jgi:ubiquinone/menaquinone biosynthesis C-methylase UbiE
VGGGTSTLVDDLLDRGYSDVTVLDISAPALEESKRRLGARAGRVQWIAGDVTSITLPERVFDLWHDRAVFHFLTDRQARLRYLELVRRSVRPGGHVVVATFGPQGPEKCSGLDVVRYDAEGIHSEFGAHFERIDQSIEVHTTPWGSEQQFVYCVCIKHD